MCFFLIYKKDLHLKVDNVKQGFIKFIEQNAECLCSIILTNKMIIEFSFENEQILCLVELETNFVAISSNLLLHDLLKIEIEKTDDNLNNCIPLKHRIFPLNVVNCT